MKKVYFVLFCAALLACGDDDEEPSPNALPDTVAPVVTITAPAANDSLLLIDVIEVLGAITDNNQLDQVRVVLINPDGSNLELSEVSIQDFSQSRQYELGQYHWIPKYAPLGTYTVTVEAKDYAKNVAKDSVTFTVHTSDISKAAFEKPFTYGLLNYASYLDWFGYNFWDNGYSFDEYWLSMVMYLMVTTDDEHSISEAEWSRFIADFGAKNQNWITWDENSDGSLNEAEFQKGISSLSFFKDWDRNQNMVVSMEEMAAGVFDRWDRNKNNLLSMDEYLEKFYTYLYRTQ